MPRRWSDWYLSGTATAEYIHRHQIKILSVERTMEPMAAAEHLRRFLNGGFLLSQPRDSCFHPLNWLALFSCSVPAICPLQRLRCLTSVPISRSSLRLTFPSLVMIPCPALPLSQCCSWKVKKNVKKTWGKHHNPKAKAPNSNEVGWRTEIGKEWTWGDESNVQLQHLTPCLEKMASHAGDPVPQISPRCQNRSWQHRAENQLSRGDGAAIAA